MCLAIVAKIIEYDGGVFRYLLTFVHLAVENTQRIFFEPFETGRTKFVFISREIGS